MPSDGGVRSLHSLLDRLIRANLEPAELTVHTPDLDHVFLALTDHSPLPRRLDHRKWSRPMTAATYTLSDTRTLLHRNLVHAQHQAAQGLGDRRERPVLGELPQSRAHRRGG
jgi:hypothetical protein